LAFFSFVTNLTKDNSVNLFILQCFVQYVFGTCADILASCSIFGASLLQPEELPSFPCSCLSAESETLFSSELSGPGVCLHCAIIFFTTRFAQNSLARAVCQAPQNSLARAVCQAPQNSLARAGVPGSTLFLCHRVTSTTSQ